MKAYYNEIDPKAAAWLRELIKIGAIAHGEVDTRSIEDVTPNDVRGYTQCHWFAGIGGWSLALRLAGWPDSKRAWTGSCPCQPFSSAGKRDGFDDKRHLWPSFHHLINQCNPAICFGEQVASKQALQWWDVVAADLEGSGYSAAAADLPAASIEGCHLRSRLFWVAVANSAGVNGKARHLLEPCENRSTQEPAGRLPSISISGGRWSADGWGECMPVIVPSNNGVSKKLAAIGNAIVPQVAAEFIRAVM